jgi:hypothetical protein
MDELVARNEGAMVIDSAGTQLKCMEGLIRISPLPSLKSGLLGLTEWNGQRG